jgi:hypothetical protein
MQQESLVGLAFKEVHSLFVVGCSERSGDQCLSLARE